MAKDLFEKIIDNEVPSWKVWEDEKYLAFLTPFPNTEGVTSVIPKENQGGYVFDLDQEKYQGLMEASRVVAKILEKAFDTPRIGMVFEGTGVDYVHTKLYPLHGKLAGETDVWSDHVIFFKDYPGYMSTVEGPKMSDEKLDEVKQKIIDVQQ